MWRDSCLASGVQAGAAVNQAIGPEIVATPPSRRAREAPSRAGQLLRVQAALAGAWPGMLTVVDRFTHECLAIDVGQRLKGDDVARTLNLIIAQRGLSRPIKTDNDSEFISKAIGKWACERGLRWTSAAPASPQTTPPSRASTADCGRSA